MREFLPYLAGLTLIAVASFLRHKMMILAQPLRLQFADKAEQLLRHDGFSPEYHPAIRQALKDAFGNRLFLSIGLFVVPVVAVMFIFMKKPPFSLSTYSKIQDSETKDLYREVMELQAKIAFANNPFLFTMLKLEIDLFLSIAISIRILLRGNNPFSPLTASSEGFLANIGSRRSLYNFTRHMAGAS